MFLCKKCGDSCFALGNWLLEVGRGHFLLEALKMMRFRWSTKEVHTQLDAQDIQTLEAQYTCLLLFGLWDALLIMPFYLYLFNYIIFSFLIHICDVIVVTNHWYFVSCL